MMVKLKSLGMFISVVMGTIQYCVLNLADEPEIDKDGCMVMEEMTSPRSQEILNTINTVFGTDYDMGYFYSEENLTI